MNTISVVSYLNSMPFVYGLGHSNSKNFIVKNEIPSQCAKSFIENKSDIALVPTGSLKFITGEYKIVKPFCIGAFKQVETVVLLSNEPFEELEKIYLDFHSFTSVRLIKVIAKEFWEKDYEYLPTSESTDYCNIEPKTGFVMIGDKVFTNKAYYKYCYDLATEWYNFTNLGFAFAVWVARPNVTDTVLEELNTALEIGVNSIPKLNLASWQKDYLNNCIKYRSTDDIQKGMDLFLQKI